MDGEVVIPIRATASITVGFHPDAVRCEGCPLCIADAAFKERKRCVLTNEIIIYPKQRGLRCPLEVETDG